MNRINRILLSAALLLPFWGCTTDDVGNPVGAKVDVVSFDPGIRYTHTIDGTQGPVEVSMQGMAVLRVYIAPVGADFQVQQSPDLTHWEIAEELSRTRVGVFDSYEVFEVHVQILVDPKTDDNGRQFFRVLY